MEEKTHGACTVGHYRDYKKSITGYFNREGKAALS